MLKALELVGFKSFADKTRFEFPAGITVVVGPNGSGKSNVVDAIRWILGEQSIKNLRGKEMVDVIFNGSTSRRALNSAEATLVFDNSDHRLPVDSTEVAVTRRVYRSGEGEYLLNRQPCRLRDIRDLFSGTGAATEAYSVIEQGKVDILLQSSPRDRRAIFEEAAGISRFKVKKIEALRRLERVEQNLLRLRDIVDEVEGRLESVRQQAGKARRYKELADRLQELRIQVGWTDWRQFTTRLDTAEAEITALRADAAGVAAETEIIETRGLALETEMAEIDRLIRTSESRIAENRERLVGLESTIEHERAHVAELEEQSTHHRRQVASLSVRTSDVEEQMQATRDAAAAAEIRHRRIASDLADQQRTLTALTTQLDQIRGENEQRRTALLEETRAAATLANEIAALESQSAEAQKSRDKCLAQQAELEAERTRLDAELSELNDRHQRLIDQSSARSDARTAARNQLVEVRRRQESHQQELVRWKERLTAAIERNRILTELESRLEGVGAGVKQMLAIAKENPTGPLGTVRGMLADLLQVDVPLAALVEMALGDKAQYLVMESDQRLSELVTADQAFSGRAGFLPLIPSPQAVSSQAAAKDLDKRPGVIGRADRFVRAASEYGPLVRHLLSRTWIVEDFAIAVELSESPAGRGSQFITVGGQLLDADGSRSIGPLQSAAGLISRRSELRALEHQIVEFKRNIAQLESLVSNLEQQTARHERDLADATTQHQQVSEQLAESRMRLEATTGRQSRLDARHATLTAAANDAEHRLSDLAAALSSSRMQAQQRETALAQAERRIHENTRRIAELAESRELRNRETIAAKVELARGEQQLDHLQNQLRQFSHDREERQRTLADSREQLSRSTERIREAEAQILSAEAELAELYLQKEAFGGETVGLVGRREALRSERTAAVEEAHRRRNRIRKLEEKLHKRELAAGQLHHERTTLVERLREDYGIDLAERPDPTAADGARGLAHFAMPGEQNVPVPLSAAPIARQRAEVEQEIAELRGQLASLGHVNLGSLEEADALEQRFGTISGQFEDLAKAKATLQQIVGKINSDSRRLFGETLQTVKEHFQGLFRDLFGGGQADIVLEEGVDILDAGIEIIARPPGKEPRNISLLSGGEKTLTCVALLLSIFRSRPSPFCVLDEVDSALDESNTERFVGVLHEFLSWTQFIIVTHSKRTMTAANTLHGVTMQESGVSKRVSVRFEDVSENGEILPSATLRPAEGGSDIARAA
jgi:chromosome segregation protein